MATILILANNDVGLYKFRKELLEELVKENEVYVSLPNGEFIPQIRELGCRFIDTPINRRGKNPITDLRLLWHYKSIIKDVKPDLVLTYTIKPNVFGGLACRMSEVPYIANITGLGTAVENGGLLQRITLSLYKVSMKKAKCIFFQNTENEEFFNKKKIINGNHRLLPGSGVNLNQYSVLDYPTTDNVVHFLFIARVMREKGIDQYLEAAEYFKDKFQKTAFHILGFCEDEYEDKLKRMHNMGIIQYHGMQHDVREFHRISHCTILPTYYPEGMSNVLLESAACGRPIITTNRSGCREIVNDKENGYVVKQQNSEDLINKIKVFLSLDYKVKKHMGIMGRKKIEKEFDRKKVVQSYLDEIEKALR